MAVPAHFSNRWQKYERKIGKVCGKTRGQKFECKTTKPFLAISWNYMLGNSWKLYAGKLGGYQRAFDEGKYGTMLRHLTKV